MTYLLPINQCLMLAKRKMADAAWEREDPRPACQDVAAAFEREAREFLDMAKAQGWEGEAK